MLRRVGLFLVGFPFGIVPLHNNYEFAFLYASIYWLTAGHPLRKRNVPFVASYADNKFVRLLVKVHMLRSNEGEAQV